MKLKKLKLNALSEAGLKDKEMNALKGGNCCTCSCYHEGEPVYSSYADNRKVNYKFDGHSVEGCNEFVYCDDDNEVVPLPSAGI